jgi:hypothetical protein
VLRELRRERLRDGVVKRLIGEWLFAGAPESGVVT